jgi:murein L,D-transpeptidase YcbB/YkuD
MKKLVLFVGFAFLVTTMMGCGKKKEEEMALDGLNGVVSENVVSVDAQANMEVPVYVENAENMGVAAGEMAALTDPAAAIAKPTSKQIQQALKNAGFYTGKVDGDIGPKTKKAIEAFQSQHGLKADGKVGAKTWRALSPYLNKSTEVANPSAVEQGFGQ